MMNAKEIRETSDASVEAARHFGQPTAVMFFLAEIAAQLAEANSHLEFLCDLFDRRHRLPKSNHALAKGENRSPSVPRGCADEGAVVGGVAVKTSEVKGAMESFRWREIDNSTDRERPQIRVVVRLGVIGTALLLELITVLTWLLVRLAR